MDKHKHSSILPNTAVPSTNSGNTIVYVYGKRNSGFGYSKPLLEIKMSAEIHLSSSAFFLFCRWQTMLGYYVV